MGESKLKRIRAEETLPAGASVHTPGGKIQVRWASSSAATPMGQLAYFIEFLNLTGLWPRWQETCPLRYVSPNAPSKADVLGTWMLSALSGHKRYSHVTAIPQAEGVAWLDSHLGESVAPLLEAPWIRKALMRVSACLQAWAKQAAEQLIPVTVWRCVCNYLKRTLASLGPPHALRLPNKIHG